MEWSECMVNLKSNFDNGPMDSRFRQQLFGCHELTLSKCRTKDKRHQTFKNYVQKQIVYNFFLLLSHGIFCELHPLSLTNITSNDSNVSSRECNHDDVVWIIPESRTFSVSSWSVLFAIFRTFIPMEIEYHRGDNSVVHQRGGENSIEIDIARHSKWDHFAWNLIAFPSNGCNPTTEWLLYGPYDSGTAKTGWYRCSNIAAIWRISKRNGIIPKIHRILRIQRICRI